MLGIYQEKEGEGNWMKREKSLQRIRGLIAYGAHSDSYFQTTLLKKLQPAITESVVFPFFYFFLLDFILFYHIIFYFLIYIFLYCGSFF